MNGEIVTTSVDQGRAGPGEVAAPDAAQAAQIKDQTLHMIGHAHIDPVWLWQWQEGFGAIKATWRSALDRMREYPEFRFSASSAAFYEWVEENEPEMFDEIRRRVAEGRWELVSGWWVEPDCNIPSGESFVRQGLYGQRYFRERFGRIATVGFNPDAFGHSAGLPQILRGQGLERYVFLRPQIHERALPRIFWWESADGSRVLAFRILYEYGTWVPELERWVRRCMPELGELSDELMVFYGVSDHGGGPTRGNLDSLRQLDQLPDLPRLERSTMGAFFERLDASGRSFPTVRGELQKHAPGCYAAHSSIKKWNRRSENLLLLAEKWAAVAELVSGHPYPVEPFRRAWKGILFNQFHDIMAGTAIEPAYDDARDLHGEARAIGARALNHAAQSIARRIRIPLDERANPLVVFNPHAWPARLDVELEFGRLRGGEILVDDDDRPVPMQVVRSHATVGTSRNRLSFVAELPPLGYRAYRLVREQEAPDFATVAATDTTLDNGRIRLEIDPETGAFSRLTDHRTGAELLSAPAARPVVLVDGYDTWGHGLDRYDQEVGEFGRATVRRIEHGPVKSVIRIESSHGSSRLIQDVAMYRELDRIDVAVTLTWAERWRALKLRFPVNVAQPSATFEVAYGSLEREPTGSEVPGQRWVDVTGTAADGSRLGLSLLNDAKYAYDVLGGEIGLTVVRSPVYAHHEPFLPVAEGRYVHQDQAQQRFGYALLPHAGGWRDAGMSRAAAEVNQRAVALAETFHDGDLPQRQAHLEVRPSNVELTVLKRAEDGEALVMRLFETAGVATEAEVDLHLLARRFTVPLRGGELATVVVPREADGDPVRTNLLEWVD